MKLNLKDVQDKSLEDFATMIMSEYHKYSEEAISYIIDKLLSSCKSYSYDIRSMLCFLIYEQEMSESFIEQKFMNNKAFADKYANLYDTIAQNQKLSFEFLSKYKDIFNIVYLKYQNLKYEQLIELGATKDFAKFFSKVVTVHNCGNKGRIIFIEVEKDKELTIHIGCFHGTYDEAINEIRYMYKVKDMCDSYISKVDECFRLAKELQKEMVS
jgi:hypothetical protein